MGEMSRRALLGTAAVAGGVWFTGGLTARPLALAEEAGWPKLPPVRIHVVYLGTGGAWPTPTFDAPAEVAKFRDYLTGVATRLGDVQFVGGELIPNTVPAATALAAKLKEADAALLVHLSFGSGEPLLKLVEAGLAVGHLLAAVQRTRLDVCRALAESGPKGHSLRRPATMATWSGRWRCCACPCGCASHGSSSWGPHGDGAGLFRRASQALSRAGAGPHRPGTGHGRS